MLPLAAMQLQLDQVRNAVIQLSALTGSLQSQLDQAQGDYDSSATGADGAAADALVSVK